MNQEPTSMPPVDTDEERPVLLQWYAYGHDFGNSEIGGVLLKYNAAKESTQVLSRSIPTAFTQLNTNILRNMGVDTSTALIIRMEGEQASYGIGSVALAQSTDPWTGRGDIHRYASSNSLRGLLAVSASFIPDKEYGLMVVTGLPAETYQKNPTLRKEIKAALSGKHTFSIDGGKTWRSCHVEIGATIMEGAGALIAYGGGKESAQGSAVIDIGGRTTDLYVARGQVPVVDFCKGKPIGVESATKMMMDAFENARGVPLTSLDARGIMHAYAAAELAADQAGTAAPTPSAGRGKKKTAAAPTSIRPAYPEISVNGQKVPDEEIDGYVREAITQTSEEIVSFVSSAWRQSDSSSQVAARFNPVLNIGGGVYYFFKALNKRIPHLTRPADDPVYANARGYARTAEQLLEKKNRKQATEVTKA